MKEEVIPGDYLKERIDLVLESLCLIILSLKRIILCTTLNNLKLPFSEA